MFTADVAISTDWLDELQEAAKSIPDAVGSYARRELRPFVSQWVDRTLRREPGPVKYPLAWESDQQKGYYFAVIAQYDAQGNVIPYQRTHQYVSSWHVQADYTNGLSSITVENLASYAQYVGGRRQQRFHRNTGWPNAADELQLISVELDERIEAGLPILIDQVLEGRYDAI